MEAFGDLWRACAARAAVREVLAVCLRAAPHGDGPCGQKFKTASRLKQHLANAHNVDVKWHVCEHDAGDGPCGQKFKTASKLKQHLANAHNVDVKWHVCACEHDDRDQSPRRREAA